MNIRRPRSKTQLLNTGTGALVKVNSDGTFTTVVDMLSLPTSMEIIKNTAYVVTLDGKIWKFDNLVNGLYGAGKNNQATSGNG